MGFAARALMPSLNFCSSLAPALGGTAMGDAAAIFSSAWCSTAICGPFEPARKCAGSLLAQAFIRSVTKSPRPRHSAVSLTGLDTLGSAKALTSALVNSLEVSTAITGFSVIELGIVGYETISNVHGNRP